MEAKTELQRNALMDARRHELNTFQRAMDMQWLDSRMEDGRMGRLLGQIQQEAELEKAHQERTDHAALVDNAAAKEASLGYEVAKVRREEVNELQRRHLLRQRDPKLRELMSKLEAGYVCRDIRRQILDHEYTKLEEKAKQKREDQLLLAAFDSKAEKEKESLNQIRRKAEYRQELQRQLVDKQRMKQCQYEETLIEKKMLDDIMRTISDEDKRELEQKRMLTEKMQQEMKTFKQAQLAWRDKQKKMVVMEQREIEEQARQAADRSAAATAERNRVHQAREDTNKIICAKIKAAEDERLHREDIITLLQQQEYIEKNINDDHEEKVKMARTKSNIKEALTEQMNGRKQLEEERKARDLELRRSTEAKVAEENRKEQEKSRLKREKNRRYAAELLQQAEMQRIQRNAGKREEEMKVKAVTDYQNAWDKEVDKERRVIIQEHAPRVIGYLQAGVLKKEDLSDVRIGANRHEDLAKLDIESMTHAKHPTLRSKCNAQCRVIREY